MSILKFLQSMNGFKHRLVLVLLIVFQGCSASKQSSRITYSKNNIHLYESIGGVKADRQKAFDDSGVMPCIVIGQASITGQFMYQVDNVSLRKEIEQKVPQESDDIIIVLNWEGPVFEVLLNHSDNGVVFYEEAKESFINAYLLVKSMRPKSLVGYYGFPIRKYWNRNEEWREANLALDDLCRNFDAIFPSLYDFYQDKGSIREQDVSYIRDNIEEAILMGQRLNKPVYPFVWHRFHPSNKDLGGSLIPPEEFGHHIYEIIAKNVLGTRVNGLIWWSAEYYFFKNSNLNLKSKDEQLSQFKTFHDLTIPVYLKQIQKAMSLDLK